MMMTTSMHIFVMYLMQSFLIKKNVWYCDVCINQCKVVEHQKKNLKLKKKTNNLFNYNFFYKIMLIKHYDEITAVQNIMNLILFLYYDFYSVLCSGMHWT